MTSSFHPTYKENTGWQTIINIMVGLALGAAVVFFMAVPAVKESLNTEHNHELARVLEQVSQKNLEITGLEDDKKSLESQLSSVQDQLNNINGENQDVVIQYQRLVQILQDYRNESLTDAGKGVYRYAAGADHRCRYAGKFWHPFLQI